MTGSNNDAGYVLVVKTDLFRKIGYFQGFSTTTAPYLNAFFAHGNTTFMERQAAERDPSFKQLIPYVILRHRSAVFSYVRGKAGAEERLIAKRSIGIGGHIDLADNTLFNDPADIYRSAAQREVREEVAVKSGFNERVVALINDDSNEVGMVHLGIVHLWDLDERAVRKKEAQITQAKFVEIADLFDIRDELESWSQIALDILGSLTASSSS